MSKLELFEATPTTVCPACNLPVEYAGKLILWVPKVAPVMIKQGHLMVCTGCKNVFFTPEVTE